MYFNYHAKIKSKIKDGKLSSFKIENNYKTIGKALILMFIDNTKYPIREHRFLEYFALIDELYVLNKINGIVYCKFNK